MERFRRKKSKASLITEGSQQIQRQRSAHNLASDSSTLKEYSTACELDRSSSRRTSGLPIKKLLAEEMSKETEAKRRSPSVVARLMGLDGMPSEQNIRTQQKNSKSRTACDISEIRRNPYECQSYMRHSKENPEFKDVYEVSEAKECVKRSKHSETEMSFIREKFMDAKRLSADNRFRNSKEFCNTLDALDTNKDLLLKFLQQPDSLYTKHLHDLEGDFAMYVSRRARPNYEKCENITVESKSKKGMSDSKYFREHLGSLSPNSYSPCSSNKSPKSSEIQLKEQHATKSPQTRIVILKPNLEKLQNARKSVSSHRRHVDYSHDVREGGGQLGPKPLSENNEFSKHNMRESRERAKMITRKMSINCGNEPIDFSSIFQGYAGDESSYSISESESGSEIEDIMLSSRKSFHWSNRRNVTFAYSHESSVSREAKKRLSKRWNISQKYQDVVSVGEVSKLGEMLGKPDREMQENKMDRRLVPDISRDRVFNDDIMDFGSHSGVDCRDNGKERYVKNVSKPGFVSDSSASCYSPESSTQSRVNNQGGKLVAKQPANRERSKEIKENVYIKSRNPKLHFRSKSGDGAEIVEKTQYDINVSEIIMSPEVSFVSKIPVNNANGSPLMTEPKVDNEHESKAFSCGFPDEFSVKQSHCLLEINNYSAFDLENLKQQTEPALEGLRPLQSPVPETESPASSKETDHPSPISVLKAPLTEDISSGSECFEKVSADLQELRMQLKLLRMESEEDRPNLELSDKDDSQEYSSETDENQIFEHATWQASYMDDTLKESGFDAMDPNMIVALWHSVECPIGPWVFENLEKKYIKYQSISKSDRMLLFERINYGLVEIFWWLVDPRPWVVTGRSNVSFNWAKNGVGYELEKLLLCEENYTYEKMLDQEMEWFDYGDVIDDIGRELEDLLVNDLVDELADMYAF